MQKNVKLVGHAFEARIYAENPENNFLPETGKVEFMATPIPSSSLRIETGVELNDEISIFYDPMIAKLVVHGPNRDIALRKLHKALCEYKVAGVITNIDFLKRVSNHPEFLKGNTNTGFIQVILSSRIIIIVRNIQKIFLNLIEIWLK